MTTADTGSILHLGGSVISAVLIQIINISLLLAGVFVLVLLIKVLIKLNKALSIWLKQNEKK